jgi:hypothetical protein
MVDMLNIDGGGAYGEGAGYGEGWFGSRLCGAWEYCGCALARWS